MNSLQIEQYLSRLNSTFSVLSRDELDNVDLSKLPVAIVINTDDRKGTGKHWCAFFVYMYRSNPVGYFFDSYHNSFKYYGFEPPFKVVGNNSKVLQSSTSETCGYWSLLWLYYIEKSKSLKYFDEKYSNNLIENDKKLLREFCKRFGALTTLTGDCQICCSRITSKY